MRAGDWKWFSQAKFAHSIRVASQDASFTFCAGTPEAGAKFEADKTRRKTEELCAKGVFDKDYCAKFEASQTTTPNK